MQYKYIVGLSNKIETIDDINNFTNIIVSSYYNSVSECQDALTQNSDLRDLDISKFTNVFDKTIDKYSVLVWIEDNSSNVVVKSNIMHLIVNINDNAIMDVHDTIKPIVLYPIVTNFDTSTDSFGEWDTHKNVFWYKDYYGSDEYMDIRKSMDSKSVLLVGVIIDGINTKITDFNFMQQIFTLQIYYSLDNSAYNLINTSIIKKICQPSSTNEKIRYFTNSSTEYYAVFDLFSDSTFRSNFISSHVDRIYLKIVFNGLKNDYKNVIIMFK